MTSKRVVTVAVHTTEDVGKGLAHRTLKDAGVTPPSPEPSVSNKSIQKAVLAELQRHGQPLSVRELIARVRQGRPEFTAVADFDVRSAILAMTAVGAIESTPTNQVTCVRPGLPSLG